MKRGVLFVSESLVSTSESVEPDLDVKDLFNDDVQDMMDEHDAGECATCVCMQHQKFYVELVGLIMHHNSN